MKPVFAKKENLVYIVVHFFLVLILLNFENKTVLYVRWYSLGKDSSVEKLKKSWKQFLKPQPEN